MQRRFPCDDISCAHISWNVRLQWSLTNCCISYGLIHLVQWTKFMSFERAMFFIRAAESSIWMQVHQMISGIRIAIRSFFPTRNVSLDFEESQLRIPGYCSGVKIFRTSSWYTTFPALRCSIDVCVWNANHNLNKI